MPYIPTQHILVFVHPCPLSALWATLFIWLITYSILFGSKLCKQQNVADKHITEVTRGGSRIVAVDEMPFVADTYVWLDTTSQFFCNASNFSKWRAKKRVSTYCYSHYGPLPNLFATTRTSMHPSSTIPITQRLSELTEERDCQYLAKLWTGVL